MREIKFRAWDDKKMYYMVEDMIEPYYNIQLAKFLDDNYGCNLMQYTGFKANDKEIYEGDVLGAKMYSTSRQWWKNLEHKKETDKQWKDGKNNIKIVKKQITFSNGAFFWGIIPLFKTFSLIEYVDMGEHNNGNWEEKYWGFEKIGNIYEHPELLKETVEA